MSKSVYIKDGYVPTDKGYQPTNSKPSSPVSKPLPNSSSAVSKPKKQ